MATKKITGFLAGTSYAPSVSTDEALLRHGCQAVNEAKISSAIVVLEDGGIWVGHPNFILETAKPDLITSILRQRLMQDDFATRTIRSDVRTRLRELDGKNPREQMAILSRIVQDYAEYFLVEAGTGMDERMRKEEAALDERCEEAA